MAGTRQPDLASRTTVAGPNEMPASGSANLMSPQLRNEAFLGAGKKIQQDMLRKCPSRLLVFSPRSIA